MYWFAGVSDGTSWSDRSGYRWGDVMKHCEKNGVSVVEMVLAGDAELGSISTPAANTPSNAEGYWQAYGIHAIQGSGEQRICGIGWVDDLSILNIIWTDGKQFWKEFREVKGQQIIWNAR